MEIELFFRGLSDIFATGRIDEVSGYLHRGLEQAEEEGDMRAAVAVLNEMAGYFRSISSYPESIRAAERALQLLRDLDLDDGVPYATTLVNAATAYRAAGDKAKARELFGAALVYYERLLPESDPRLAALYNNLSAVHQDLGEYGPARDLLGKAAAILERAPGAELDAATVRANLALALFGLGQEEEAGAALHEAMRLFESEGVPDARRAPHYAAAQAALAAAYCAMRRFDEAVALYEDAMRRIKDCFGENKDYALVCLNSALAYEALGQHDTAGEYRRRAEVALAALNGGGRA